MFTKFAIVVLTSLSLANEAPPPAAGGEAAKPGAPPAVSTPAWVELEAKITELSAKIKNKESILVRLLEEKKKMSESSPHVKETIETIVREHKELTTLINDYEKKRSLLKYRFPERGAKADRTYKKIEVRSLQDVEQGVGLDGKLSRNIKRMRSQYGSHGVEESTAPEATIEKKTPVKSNGAIDQEGTVILNK